MLQLTATTAKKLPSTIPSTKSCCREVDVHCSARDRMAGHVRDHSRSSSEAPMRSSPPWTIAVIVGTPPRIS